MSPREATAEVEIEATERDYVMARLAAARSCAQSVIDAIDEAVALFVDPEDDGRGRTREGLIKDALEAGGALTRALESAEEAYESADPTECEPWDGEEDEEESEDEAPLPRATARQRRRS